MKKLIKYNIHYLKSIYWYLQTITFSNRFYTEDVFENIYIICPGPSLSSFKERVFPENTLIIFINHAAKISKEFNSTKLLFTTDTIRAMECLSYDKSLMKIIAIGHFFQLKREVIQGYKFIIPKIEFDYKYGLIGKRCSKVTTAEMGKNCGIGFGSLLNALSFSTRFKPKSITLVGCDFGEKNSEKYAFKFKGFEGKIPYSDILSQFKRIEKIILEMGISIQQFSH